MILPAQTPWLWPAPRRSAGLMIVVGGKEPTLLGRAREAAARRGMGVLNRCGGSQFRGGSGEGSWFCGEWFASLAGGEGLLRGSLACGLRLVGISAVSIWVWYEGELC